MTDENLPQVGGGEFEGLKKVNDYGANTGVRGICNPFWGIASGGGSRTPSRKP